MAALLLLLAFVLLWASGYVVGALGVAVADPLALLVVRFLLASLVIVPLALRVPGWRRAPYRRLVTIGLLLQAVQFGFGYSALRLGVHPALMALVMLGLTPLVTTAAAGALAMEQPRPATWAALAAGLLGVAVSLAPSLGDARVGAGVALVLVAMLGLAGGSLLQKRWGGDVDPRIAVAVQSLVGAAVLGPVALLSGQTHVTLGPQFVECVLWLAWAGTVGAMVLQALLLQRLPLSVVSATLLTVPPVTALMALALLGDPVAPLTLVGMPITLAAVAAVVRRRPPTTAAGRAPVPARR
ncbi:DMT family transporter [Patulibacter defluvii]|uniref:DMT family transporter n=1 Tax=Patulibacter defluvii TaxID=3095358 RepID=UPI002A759433|nr:DMT family transporter [Patulibacter sp. DM4]